MGRKLALIFNHEFTQDQVTDALNSLGVEKIESMPEDVANIWAEIPPQQVTLKQYLLPLKQWLTDNFAQGDCVLIQGDFGACYLMADFALRNGFIPVYSTTVREATQTVSLDGSVLMTHRFKHVMFRKYGE